MTSRREKLKLANDYALRGFDTPPISDITIRVNRKTNRVTSATITIELNAADAQRFYDGRSPDLTVYLSQQPSSTIQLGEATTREIGHT